MAIFKKADLKAKGLNDEQIDFIMTESSRSLSANYTLTSDVQARIDEALQNAQQSGNADISTNPAYQQVVGERDMLRAIEGEDFKGVKPKFREQVYGMLDRSEGAASTADQLKTISEKYEEYFEKQEEAKKPQFGDQTKGSLPSGKTGASFMDTWGFVPKT